METIDEKMEQQEQEHIEMIMRQTDYTEEVAREKLKQHNNQPILVIKEFMGINEKQKKNIINSSLNQEIYRQIRYNLEDVRKGFVEREQMKEENHKK